MNVHGINQMRCPTCVGSLTLHVFNEETSELDEAELHWRGGDVQRADLGRVIRHGLLVCSKCAVWYPIDSYVPIMLVFWIPFHDYFFRKHQPAIAALTGIGPPRGEPQPGERSVQQTFTEEWDTVLGSDLTFSYTKEDLRELHRRVWLKWDENPPADVRRILNVGCGGLGAEAEALHSISRADTFSLDLNLTLLHAGTHPTSPQQRAKLIPTKRTWKFACANWLRQQGFLKPPARP